MTDLPNCTFIKRSPGFYELLGPHCSICDFLQDVSGYYYVWFNDNESGLSRGGYPDYFFLWCYEKLKELNKPRDDSVNEYFKENN